MLTIRAGRSRALALGMSALAALVTSTASAQSVPDAGVTPPVAPSPAAPSPVAPPTAAPADAPPTDAPAEQAPPQDEAPVDVATPEEAAAAPDGEEGVTSATGFACAEIMDDNGNVQRLRRNGIVGVVKDGATGETIIEGAVQVVGGRRVFTNYDGCFQIELPPGTYALRVFYDLYQTARVTNIVVRRGEATEVTVDLQPDTETLAEVVVTARADRATEATQLELRRQSASVSDAISAQEIARSPDSNAADATRRVVAATIVGGQYLFVRGLGGRYTNTMLNGTTLPSLDPDAPGVQLDLFPANVLTSLTISKTFTPDLPGDMVGGAMSIATREFPTRFRLNTSVSLGLNTNTSFQQMPSYSGGSTDFLGFDDGTRALPSNLPSAPLDDRDIPRDEYLAIAGGFQNVWAISPSTALPNIRIGFDVGDTVQVAGHDLGYLLTATYGHSSQQLSEVVRTIRQIEEGQFAIANDLRRESGTDTAVIGALGALSYQLDDDQTISLTVLAANVADQYAGQATGQFDELGEPGLARRLRWTQRGMLFGQLAGDHKNVLGSARLRWQFAVSAGERIEPDTRDLIYRRGGDGTYSFYGSPSSGSRLFQDLTQIDFTGGADLSIPIGPMTTRFGLLFREGTRNFEMRRFRHRTSGGTGDLGPEQLFAPERLLEGQYIQEFTGNRDGYSARQSLYAAFAMLDWPIVSWLRVVGGVRTESFRQVVESSSPFAGSSGDPADSTRRTNIDPLPAASLVFGLADQMYLRAAYGVTVARPLVREVAPFVYPDFLRSRQVAGNPTVRRTLVHGVDLRWEWFPGANEVLAVSGFYKYFIAPIESTVVGFNNDYTFKNIDSARIFGGEAEARLSLGRITDALDAFTVGANLTLVDSLVSLSPEQRDAATSKERPLAGQSPVVANVSLGYSPTDSSISVRLYYNVFGKRLVDVGLKPIPDVYQLPQHTLDATFIWEPNDSLKLKFAVENILNAEYLLQQGTTTVLSSRQGQTFSVGLSWSP